MPPESGSTLSLGAVGELGEVEQLGRSGADLLAGQAEVAAVDPEVLLDGELLVEGVALRAAAEPGADGGAVTGRVEPEQPQLATGHR